MDPVSTEMMTEVNMKCELHNLRHNTRPHTRT